MKTPRKKIVVVGGGFAGINLLKRFRKDSHYDVTLVDGNNFHQFPPLLYQVAMALIEPSNIIYPFRRMFQRKTHIRFHMGCLQRVNTEANTIETDTGMLFYDYLVLAVGTVPNFFGMENVRRNSWPLKSVSDATNLRNHLLLNIEKAIRSKDPDEREARLNVVIAGGGPTGVEVAGMLAQMVRNIGPKEYPEVYPSSFHIYLVEAGGELLGSMCTKAQKEALKALANLGVKIILNTAVKDFVDDKVILSSGRAIATHALIWTSGVVGADVAGLEDDQVGRGARVLVDEYNKVKGTDNVFAIGDVSLNTIDPRFPYGHPQLAQVAIQQGTLLGENFLRECDNKKWKPFHYKDMGSLAIISKYKAVADLPKIFFKGFAAWIVWLFVHLIPLAGFRNKIGLALSWAWAFFTNDPTLRLIIRPDQRDKSKKDDVESDSQLVDLKM